MSAKVSCTVLRGGERGDSRTLPGKPNNLMVVHESCHDYIHMGTRPKLKAKS
jgi:hypothetical protein